MSQDYLKPGESLKDYNINPSWSPGSGLPKYNDPSMNGDGSKPSLGGGSFGAGSVGGGAPLTTQDIIDILSYLFTIVCVGLGLVLGFRSYTHHWMQIAFPTLFAIGFRVAIWYAWRRDKDGQRKYKRFFFVPVVVLVYLVLNGDVSRWLWFALNRIKL